MIQKLTHFSLILILSACATPDVAPPIPPEQMLLGTWNCATEYGVAQGSTEYKSDGTFFGDDRVRLPHDEDGNQMVLHLNTDGEWSIESNVLIDAIVGVQVVGAETSGQPMIGEELDTIKPFYQKLIGKALKDGSTSHSDILVLTNEEFVTVDRDGGGRTTCSRKPEM